MRALASFLATLLIPAAVAAQPAATPSQPAGGPASGLALELRLETSDYLIDNDVVLPVTDAGIFIGYQMPRVSIGVGLDFGRVTQVTDFDGNSNEWSSTTFVLMPGARVTVARGADGKTELVLAGDLGFGQTSFSSSDGGEPEQTQRLRLQAGPGLRYWVSPAFALGGTTGLRYDRLSRDDEFSSASLASTSLYTSLNLTGVF